MQHRLILVEGIPGSGKTTLANKIKDYLEMQGLTAVLYSEGDAHPADLSWQSCLTIDEYNQLLEDYPDHNEQLEKVSLKEGPHVIIPYTRLGLPMKGSSLIGYLEKKEIYRDGVTLDEFKEAHFRRWSSFAKSCLGHDDQIIYIFECAYFQNHVNQLLGTYCLDETRIKDYMIELMATVKDLNPFLFYLTQPNVEETIDRIAKERVSPDKSKWDDWIDLMIAYIEKLPYVKEKNYIGYEGGIQFIKDRKDIELSIFDKLQIPKAMIYNDRYDWDAVYKDLEGYLEKNICPQ